MFVHLVASAQLEQLLKQTVQLDFTILTKEELTFLFARFAQPEQLVLIQEHLIQLLLLVPKATFVQLALKYPVTLVCTVPQVHSL